MTEGRSLTEQEIEAIQKNIFNGCYHVEELASLVQTLMIYRRVFREIFALFHKEPLRRVSTTDAVPNSLLAHYAELVAMENLR